MENKLKRGYESSQKRRNATIAEMGVDLTKIQMFGKLHSNMANIQRQENAHVFSDVELDTTGTSHIL
jgi:hypothetical protein